MNQSEKDGDSLSYNDRQDFNFRWQFHVRIEWKPRDMWVGVYYDNRERPWEYGILICLVPMLPIHIRIYKKILSYNP